ncbi:hypothetical protein QBC39DRAFT_185207 [Podospora conica]|nr:hypothetical protein QBC39DRAFT_185207 [Schizothecium conicum]
MRLIPLTVEAAIAGLVKTTTRALDMATPALEVADDGPSIAGRVKFEVRCVRVILRQLEYLPLANLKDLSHFQRRQIKAVDFVALLGEAVLALDSLTFLLDSDGEVDEADAQSAASQARERVEELVDALWRLQDFRTSMWLLLNVLQSPYGTDVQESLESLGTAVSCLMDGDSKVAKRLRDSDVYTLHLRNSVQLRERLDSDLNRTPDLSLADMNSIVTATVPVCSGDLLDPSLYVFQGALSVDQDAEAPNRAGSPASDSSSSSPISTPTSSPSRSTRDHGRHASINTILASPTGSSTPPFLKKAPPASCALIFHLRQTTPIMILHLFQHALSVSPRFKTHDLPDLFNPPDPSQLLRQQKGKQKVRPPHDIVAKFRLHNLSSSQRESLASSSATEEEAAQNRLQKQQKLRGLSDHQLRRLCVEVYDELVRRNVVDKRLKALVDSGTGGGDGGYMVGGPNVREGDVEAGPVAGEPSEVNQTLAGMEDSKFLELCGDACWELRRRDVEAKAVAGEAVVRGGDVGVEAEETNMSRLPDDNGADSEDPGDQDEEEDHEHKDDNQLKDRGQTPDTRVDEEPMMSALQAEDKSWRKEERVALRESFLEKKQEIDALVSKYEREAEAGHTLA